MCNIVLINLLMKTKIGNKALISNPALNAFDVLIGEWQTTGSHPLVPGITLHGRVLFERVEGGAFLMMRSEVNEPNFPDGVAILRQLLPGPPTRASGPPRRFR